MKRNSMIMINFMLKNLRNRLFFGHIQSTKVHITYLSEKYVIYLDLCQIKNSHFLQLKISSPDYLIGKLYSNLKKRI